MGIRGLKVYDKLISEVEGKFLKISLKGFLKISIETIKYPKDLLDIFFWITPGKFTEYNFLEDFPGGIHEEISGWESFDRFLKKIL